MLAPLDFRTSFQIGSLTFCCTFPSRKLEILTFWVEWNTALAPVIQNEVRDAFTWTVLRQLGHGGGSHPPHTSALMEISAPNCIPSQPFVAEQDLSSAPSCVSHSLKLWRETRSPHQKPFGIEGQPMWHVAEHVWWKRLMTADSQQETLILAVWRLINNNVFVNSKSLFDFFFSFSVEPPQRSSDVLVCHLLTTNVGETTLKI